MFRPHAIYIVDVVVAKSEEDFDGKPQNLLTPTVYVI